MVFLKKKFFPKKNILFNLFSMQLFSADAMVFSKKFKKIKKKKLFDPEKIRKRASKLLIIQPKSQFLFHKNFPPRDFSIMTLPQSMVHYPQCPQMDEFHAPWTYDNDVSRQEWPRVKNLIEWPESKWMTMH